MLFDPANLIFLCFDFEKAATMLEHLERLAIRDFPDTVRHGGHAIMQVHLPRGNIHGFVVLGVKAIAPTQEGEYKREKQGRKGLAQKSVVPRAFHVHWNLSLPGGCIDSSVSASRCTIPGIATERLEGETGGI
jgi:hypothetical protein